MALGNTADITFKKGSSETLLLTVTDETGARVDLTGARVKATVKSDITSATEDIVKDSAVGVSEVEILDQTPTGTTVGQAEIKFVPSDTTSLVAGEYFYDIWVELASGVRKAVVCVSSFFIQQGVTTF